MIKKTILFSSFLMLCLLSTTTVFGQDVVKRNRVCSVCQQSKPISAFSSDSKTCKLCVKKAHEKAEKERIAREQAERERIARKQAERERIARTINGHEWVDLGLSVKWATCNVGGSSPLHIGSFFAWGETSSKSDYSWETYKYHLNDKDSKEKYSKYVTDKSYGIIDNKVQLDISDDAAHVNWGGSWRMPTKEEFDELIAGCVWSYGYWLNYGLGFKITSKKNGKFIYLPATGLMNGRENIQKKVGFYWSSSLDLTSTSNSFHCGCYIGVTEGCMDWVWRGLRKTGRAIRPVTR